jgi:hypothetical protein
MKDYILIWDINDYPDNGGGTEYDLFENISDVEKKVNELTEDTRDISISFCGRLREEIKFKAVEKVTRWEVDS